MHNSRKSSYRETKGRRAGGDCGGLPAPGLRADARGIITMRGLRSFAYGLLAVILGIALTNAGFSPSAIGILITVSLLGDFFGTYVIGLFADRFGRRGDLDAGRTRDRHPNASPGGSGDRGGDLDGDVSPARAHRRCGAVDGRASDRPDNRASPSCRWSVGAAGHVGGVVVADHHRGIPHTDAGYRR